MKIRNTILAVSLITAVPLTYALEETRVPKETGNPAQSVPVQKTESATGPNAPTDQATGAREERTTGTPGKMVRTTERDTVDASGTIADALDDAENFTTLKKAVEAAGLNEVLDGPGPFTVFAPTDAAFDKIPKETLEDWMKPENKEQLKKVLLGHVAAGEWKSDAITPGKISSSSSQVLTVAVDGDKVMINDATVVQPDIDVANGVIHAIDTVIVPEM